jgi:hypothetical protein
MSVPAVTGLALPGSTEPVGEIAILWLSAGLSCDGDTIAMTAATQPKTREGMPDYLAFHEARLAELRAASVAGAVQ